MSIVTSSHTVLGALRAKAVLDPERIPVTFLVDGERAERLLAWRELDTRARAIAAALQAAGLRERNVLLLFPAGLEYVVAFLGCVYAGAVAVPVYPPDPGRFQRTFPRLVAIAADAEPAAVLMTTAVAQALDTVQQHVPPPLRIPWINVDAVQDSQATHWEPPMLGRDSVALLQYTSGSTSVPKGVVVTHGNLTHNHRVMCEAVQPGNDAVYVSWLPVYHDMGLIGKILHPLMAGARVVLMPPGAFLLKPVRWLRAISRYRGTVCGGPNFGFDLCVRKVSADERAELDLRSWLFAPNAAEMVRLETMQAFTRLFTPCGFRGDAFRPLYGLAESTLMTTGSRCGSPVKSIRLEEAALACGVAKPTSDPKALARTLVGCGRWHLDTKVAIVDPRTRRRASEGVIGEVWVSGGSVARGYFKRPADSEQAFGATILGSDDGPFLRTGDLGFIHEGELFITGRRKELIILRGRNLYPYDLERTVELSHPALRPGCCAAFGTDKDGAERLVIVAEHGGDRELATEAAAAALRCLSAEHGVVPDDLVLLARGAMLKSTSGKIQRVAMREAYESRNLDAIVWQLAGDEAVAREQQPAHAWLCAEVSRMLRLPQTAVPIDVDGRLADLGLDSVQLAELKQRIEARFGAVISEAHIQAEPIARLLSRLGASQKPPPKAAPSPAVCFRLSDAAPELHAHLLRARPWLAGWLARLEEDIPIAPTNNAFDTGALFRPRGHFRAFYVRGPDGDVIAIKGGDVRCQDQLGFLQLLSERPFERFARFSATNVLEYFLLQERKLPGALMLAEALAEAEAACRVQCALFDRFGELGDLPVPLLVTRWSEQVTARFASNLLPLLHGLSLGIAEQDLQKGIGCYVYYFPKPPYPRVSHFAGELAQESMRKGAAGIQNTRLVYATLQAKVDPQKAIEAWIDLAARMLVAGYFPCQVQHFKNGQSIEAQNVLLNGAFADLDSTVAMKDLRGDRDFYAHFLAMMNLLTNTVRVLLVAENNGTTALPSPFPAQFPKPDFIETLIVIHLWEGLKKALMAYEERWPGCLDRRLAEIVTSSLSFPVLFDRILHAIYYAGPEIPRSVLHMLSITDVYSESPHDNQPGMPLELMSRLDVDAAALVSIPQSFLQQIRMDSDRFVQDALRNEPTLLTIYQTSLGRIGLVLIPIEEQKLFVQRSTTLHAVHAGLSLAHAHGAKIASLTGLIPSATEYGRAVVQDLAPPGAIQVTTGHATTAACFVLMVERILEEAARDLREQSVALIGLGSIGASMLRLLLAILPHPRVLTLVDLASRRDALDALATSVREDLQFTGRLAIVLGAGGSCPEEVYDSTLILSATNAPSVIDIDRVRPGTLLVDDSAPHCFDPRRAIRRFQEHRDVLFTEAGAVQSPRPIREVRDLHFATGWDDRIRSALSLVHPAPAVLMGCVLSSLLTARFSELRCTIGLPALEETRAHHDKLKDLGFSAAPLYCEDMVLDERLVRLFRIRIRP